MWLFLWRHPVLFNQYTTFVLIRGIATHLARLHQPSHTRYSPIPFDGEVYQVVQTKDWRQEGESL